MLIINALAVYTSVGGHTVMAPYEATVTYTVKMSSDVECHISNRVGSSFMRMRINLKGISFSFYRLPSQCNRNVEMGISPFSSTESFCG